MGLVSDLEIWRVHKDEAVILAVVRTIPPASDSWDDVARLELRIAHNGQIYLTDLRRDQADIENRSAALLRDLEAHGWILQRDAHQTL